MMRKEILAARNVLCKKDEAELPAVCKVPAGKDPGQGHDLQG